MTRLPLLCLSILFTFLGTAEARPPMKQLLESYSTAETQRLLIRDASHQELSGLPIATKDSKLFVFPIGERRVQLSNNPPQYDKTSGTLLYTVLIYRTPSTVPMSAATYVLRDSDRDPVALTDGYASQERATFLRLSGATALFAVIERAFPAAPDLFNSGVIDEVSSTPRTVWITDPQISRWTWGFAELDGTPPAELIARSSPLPTATGKQSLYAGFNFLDSFSATAPIVHAYHWSGNSFDPFDTLPQRLSTLPDETWRFGAH